VQSDRRLPKTSTFKSFMKSVQHMIGYVRNKKTQETKELHYEQTADHPIQTKNIL